MGKYYAIKIGKDVKDKIVESWEECEKYIIGYSSIYKSFKSKKEAKRYLESFSNEKIEYCLMINEIQRFNRLKEEIEMQYHFTIPAYVIDEMINGKNVDNLRCLINLAVMNNRLSKKNAQILKESVKSNYFTRI